MTPAAQRGRLVATVLSGSWRRNPPEPRVSGADLANVTPLLQRSGAGGLGWWAIRDSALSESSPGAELRQTYRFDAIQATQNDHWLQHAWKVLESAGAKPLLAKGWAAARLYPEPGLRPYYDFDVLVPPEHQPAAAAAIRAEAGLPLIDLHTHFAELLDRPLADLYAHSVVAPAGDVGVRMLGPEDHLRLLSQHLLRHAAWRPAWLCDIGALAESLRPEFDWDYCLQGDPRRSHWVCCTLALAQQLLDARIPAAARGVPAWLVQAVHEEWGRGTPRDAAKPLFTGRRRFSAKHALTELRRRWPSPVVATIFWRAAFDGVPRFPLQLAQYVASQALATIGRRWTLAGFE